MANKSRGLYTNQLGHYLGHHDLHELSQNLGDSGDWECIRCLGAALCNALEQIEALKRRVALLERQNTTPDPIVEALNSGDGSYRP